MISRVFNFMKESKAVQLNNKLFLDLLSASPSAKPKPLLDVFINHRGSDTKRNIATLLYDNLRSRNLRPFLDCKNMKPGDKLFDHINSAILTSKVAVTVFSPNYCDSYFCLHELALIMESRKRVIPIFCDIKPSQLDVMIERLTCSDDEIQRFRWALQEAKDIVGLTFDSYKGNLSEVVTVASDVIVERLIELEAEDGNF
ncbi:PREDICTED: TMV resistance protein N-like [Camelina sativa]|uniref:TMV resistance protein N-like n=1 Tax=Camelina sativa TaxID=90675 RepID=A0ABM0YJK6_CAMSA|nr:PREDICTED: TMV resistance protein N-like [Camelina sativa]